MRWIERAVAESPRLALVPGRCALGHATPGEEWSRGFDYEYHSAANEFRGVRCTECGAWFLDPRPAERDFGTIYPDSYSAYAMSDASGAARGLAFRAKAWLEARKIRRYRRFLAGLHGDVLDVGCGDAQLLDGFARAGVARGELVGLDFHPVAVRLARAKGYEVIEGTLETAALGRERFRLAVMNQLIEHVVDPVAALARLREALVPGGCVFLETPNLASPNARIARARTWGGYHWPRHLHLFSPTSMEQVLTAAGLELVEVRYVPCPVQWVLTLHNALQERAAPPSWLLRFTDWRNPVLLALFTVLELPFLRRGTANMQVVARRAA